MIKIYKWSDILNYVCRELHSYFLHSYDKPTLSNNTLMDIISKCIEDNLQEDYYKFTSIVFVRSGSPTHNEVNPNNDIISPYYACDFANNYEQSDNIHVRKIVDKEIDILEKYIQYVLNKEYPLWCKIKKVFSEFDVNFIEFKNMYECDIEYYIKNRMHVVYSNFDNSGRYTFDKYIRDITNSEYESRSVFDYSISKIERALV